jgi:ADP-ribose pyrophosphatase YjhB (NUDIX family)
MVNADALVARLRLSRVALEIAKSKSGGWGKWERYPAGTSKGGQFAPKGGGGSSVGNMWSNTFHEVGGPGWGHYAKPKAPPPGAKPHPKTDDHGKAVSIDYPSKPSHSSSWGNAKQSAVFVPGGEAPKSLHGVPMKPWSPPEKGWASVTGTNPKIDIDFPFDPHPTKKTGAGVLIVEPDGRLWLTRPTNAFGGYQNTYPKGTAEGGLTLQQNAIKEAWEETGLKVKITGVLGDYDRDTSRARFYIAVREGGTPRDMGWESQAMTLATIKDARTLLNRSHDRDILADLEELFSISKRNPGSKGGHWQNQPRWPGGSALGGQWKTMGADGITLPPVVAGGVEGKYPQYQKKIVAVHAAAQQGDKAKIQAVADKEAKYATAFASGDKNSGHMKWHASVHQYALQVLHDLDAGTKAGATADRVSGPPKLSEAFGAVVGNKPGGSNPGAMHADKSGEKWLIKGNKQLQIGSVSQAVSNDRARNEVLASKLMIAAGVGAPEMKLVDLEGKYGGGVGVASKWMPGSSFNPNLEQHIGAARSDFAVHAWLANYDVLGMVFDNTTVHVGKAQNIDPGGALLFRAQGLPKGASHGVVGGLLDKNAPEFESMRQTTAEQKHVYGGMTQSDLYASAEKLKAISDDTIRDLVKTYGPGNADARAAFAQNLIDRKNAILGKAGHTFQMKAGAVIASSAAPEAPSATSAAAPVGAGLTDKDKLLALAIAAQNAGNENFNPAKFAEKALGNFTVNEIKDAITSYTVATPVSKYPYAPQMVALFTELLAQKQGAAALSMRPGPAKQTIEQQPTPTATGAGLTGKAKLEALLQATKDAGYTGSALANYLHNFDIVNVDDAKQQALGLTHSTSSFAPQAAAFMMEIVRQKQAEQARIGEKLAEAVVPTLPKAPEFSTGFQIADAYYAKLTDKIVAAHASGDIGALTALASKKDGTAAWPSHTQNGKKMQEFYDALLADAQVKQAGNVAAGVQMADAALSTPASIKPGPTDAQVALPNFEAAKLPASHSHAVYHNGKIDTIAKLAQAGDIKGLLSVGVPNNYPGSIQAKAANDALAALGSSLTVTKGQKKNSHPALFGGVDSATAHAAMATVGLSPPKPAIAKPNLAALDVSKAVIEAPPTFSASSKAWVNEANNALAKKMFEIAQSGNLTALQSMTFQAIDKDTGQVTQRLAISNHPSKPLFGYHQMLVQTLDEIANPPEPLKAFSSRAVSSFEALSKAFPSVPHGTTVAKMPKNQQLGFWVALGKVENPKPFIPKETAPLSPSMIQQAYAKHKTAPPIMKKWIDHMQSSSSLNTAYRDGKTEFAGMNLKEATKAALDYATEKPAGTTIWRWQSMSSDMVAKIMSTEPGTIIQATGPMCCSYSETATKGFGSHKVEIVYAPGAKAVTTFGSGGFASEKEVTTIPNSRFVLLSAKKTPGGKVTMRLLMLPPDPGL